MVTPSLKVSRYGKKLQLWVGTSIIDKVNCHMAMATEFQNLGFAVPFPLHGVSTYLLLDLLHLSLSDT